MIRRNALEPLRILARQMPVLTITGPRQAGKSTLCRALFPDRPLVNLEPLDVRQEVQRDPRGFLARHRQGVIVDEVQNVPELLSYIQEDTDRDPTPGRFVLTGSQHFGLSEAITQSLAGRTAVFELLPPSLDELRRFPSAPTDLMTTLWMGAYPRVFDQGLDPARWYADYATTYLQRDVRQVLNVGDLQTFTTFLRLCAGRTAQELVLQTLGADAGVAQPTARAWLSVLETSFICHRCRPWSRNVRKQAIKTPKLHFFDSGLACHLLGIRSPEHLANHPLRGAIFESWVVAEIYKARAHAGHTPALTHHRESRGVEIDLIVEAARGLLAVEVKSGATVASDFFRGLDAFSALVAGVDHRPLETFLVYGGERESHHETTRVLPWSAIQEIPWSDSP